MGRAKLTMPIHQLEMFCRRHHICKLALFGSVLRDDFGPDSDVDVLVEFEPGHVPGLAFFNSVAERLTSRFERVLTPECATMLS